MHTHIHGEFRAVIVLLRKPHSPIITEVIITSLSLRSSLPAPGESHIFVTLRVLATINLKRFVSYGYVDPKIYF